MFRAFDALREWLRLRSRLREEYRFHLHRSAADFRALGLSPRAASRTARRRFGSRRNLKLALRELGGDLPGLARMFHAHRVPASPWFQPAILLMAAILILLLSPAPRAIIEGIAGQPFPSEERHAVFLSAQARNLSYAGITPSDFESLRSLGALTGIQRYLTIHARARALKGATVAAIESQVRAKTGNPRLRVIPMFERRAIVMQPAKALWGFIALCSVFLLRPSIARFNSARRWLIYGFLVACLHSLVSLIAWAFAIQIWNRIAWSTDGRALLAFLALFMVYLGIAALQCRYWWRDLHRRCPSCLDALLLSLTEGTPDRVLLNSATTESVCAHGHGVLVENRWSRRFRPEESSLEGLVRA